MKVLAINHGDGSNPQFKKIIKTLIKEGINVSAFAWDRLNKYDKYAIIDGINFHFILRGGGYRNWLLIFWYPLWMIVLFLKLIFIKVDLIYASNFETAFPAAIAGLFNKIPFLYHVHDNLCLTYKIPLFTDGIFRIFDKWVLKRASAIIYPDECRIEKHSLAYRNKIIILPNVQSISITPYEFYCKDLKPIYDIYVNGTIWRTRGIINLLRAADKVPRCSILMAGNIPEKKVMHLVRNNKKVLYLGNIDHREALKYYLYSRAIFAFYDPSIEINRFACPMKLYEAMMMAKPIFINSETSVSKMVEDWGIGYSCRYNDIDNIANIIKEIMEKPEEADKKGVKARKIYEEKFKWENYEPILFKTINKIIDKK